MHQYDTTLKALLRGSAKLACEALFETPVARWLDVELPKVQNQRADLLGETKAGGLIHLELQSFNDQEMPLRMIEYCLGVYRLFERFPRQIVLYVGEAPLRMQYKLKSERLVFRYDLVDIRELDGERLVASEQVGDNVIAILTRLRDGRQRARDIVRKIAGSEPSGRESAVGQLLILAGLRSMEETVEREVRQVPILNDILEHKVLGREYKRGLQEGLQEGRQEGRQEGELTALRRLIQQRFGDLSEADLERLASKSLPELEDIGGRLLSAENVDELLA